jgi:hypothetical protein
VRHVALRVAEIVVLPTAVLVVVLLLAPGRAELAVHVYVLVLLAAALASVVGSIASQARTGQSQFDAALLRPTDENGRLAELVRLEREVALAQASEFDLYHRLRPALREIATGLLFVRCGVDLDRQPERARELLGEETFELVRGDREPPWDRSAPGPGLPELQRVVAGLEALR